MKKIIVLILIMLISVVSKASNDTINFSFSNIVDIVKTKTNNYVIEYDDPDCFDYERIMEQNGDNINVDYISIYVNDINLFKDFLNDYYKYKSLKDYKNKSNINRNYKIIEYSKNKFYLTKV